MFDTNLDHVDQLSASLSGRERLQVAGHVRTLEAQTLDALLRIEELLAKLVEAKGNDAAKVYAPTVKPVPAAPATKPKSGK